MKNLYRHELDFDRTMKFVKDNLTDVNSLSSELLNLVDFKSGVFFTLLTLGSDLERLYEFKNGIILPQFPVIVSEIDGKKSLIQKVPTIKEELSDFIFHKLKSNQKLSCVFDEVTLSPDDPSLKVLYEKKCVFLHEDEVTHEDGVTYVIREHNKNHETILNCMRKSFSFWHSVGVVTEADYFKTDTNIFSLEDIQAICKNAKMIIISAYDGEAYILWEKASQE
ncbi:MAG: hypothetical protein CK425_08485 [Parachlamydia sp.]|nr:MAG: hypothetical protein CK425_08485 [Parachlamydia sp.]